MALITNQQKRLVEALLQGANQTEAAREAGYTAQNLKAVASAVLKKPHVAEFLAQRESFLQACACLVGLDAVAMIDGPTPAWITKRIVALVCEGGTKASDRLTGLKLLAQISGLLKESGQPFQVTPILLTASGEELMTLSGSTGASFSLSTN